MLAGTSRGDPACATTRGVLDVITVGEAMALFIAEQPGPLAQVHSFRRATAGAELNVAIGLRRLGLTVGYVSRLGRDSLGENLLAFMDAEGIDRQQLRIDDRHATGFMFKSLEIDGRDPAIEYFRRGSAASHLGLADLPTAYCAASRHLHLTGISPALSVSSRELVFEMARQARAAGRSVSFDPNLRPQLWPSPTRMVEVINDLAGHADLVMPGLGEGRLLTGLEDPQAIAAHYLERGARQVVVKLGEQGAWFADATHSGRVAAVPVERVVDTVGAGDGFAVGVISALLEALPLADAVRRGSLIGARVVQFPGDCDGLPNRQQLEQDAAALLA